MPPTTSVTYSVEDNQNPDDGQMDSIKQQNMMLYVVCAMGAALLLIIVVCIGCKIKDVRTKKKMQERRKARNLDKDKTGVRSGRRRSPKVRPQENTENNTTQKTRRRSQDMRKPNGADVTSTTL